MSHTLPPRSWKLTTQHIAQVSESSSGSLAKLRLKVCLEYTCKGHICAGRAARVDGPRSSILVELNAHPYPTGFVWFDPCEPLLYQGRIHSK